MLLRVEVSNHRSIMDPVELSMIAVDADRVATRGFDLLNERALTVAGIYGPNASGKSNVLDGIVWVADAVASSLRVWGDVVPRDPFRFGTDQSRPSTFEVEMVVEGVRYAYRLEVDWRGVLFEGLYSYPERKRRTLMEREGEEIHLRRGSGNPGAIRELTTPTSLALTAAMRVGETDVQMFARSLAGMAPHGALTRRRSRRWVGATASTRLMFDDRFHRRQDPMFGQEPLFEGHDPRLDERAAALGLLRFADLGIDDVEIVDPPSDGAEDASDGPRRSLRLVRSIRGERMSLPLDQESNGTRTWFWLIGPILEALRAGRVLLLDEIDASLHPHLSMRLLELFQDPETNPLGAQLIFTTHDTSLLNHLNRDEVWLTEKDQHGATTLTALAEYGGDKVRRSLNLESAYLRGRFGAVPQIDQARLRRALGIAEVGER